MLVGLRRGVSNIPNPPLQATATGMWQAGFSSVAYRLAHLVLPWPFAVAGFSVFFYLV
ncbi:MAG TPA: hypothetical protein VL418_14870 [Devosiaceae bacterium]|nr:hypothetical protein [Devosiaceae bacterium]